MTEPGHVPDWVRETRETYFLRARDWATQAWACTMHPHRFCAEWARGEREALNPARFFAFGLAVALSVRWLAKRLAPELSSFEPQAEWAKGAIFQQVLVLVLASALHPLLRLRSRAPLRATIGAVAFGFGGPGAFFSAIAYGVGVTLALTGHGGHDVRAVGGIARAIWTSAAVAGAHQRHRAWTVVVFVAYATVSVGIENLGHLLKSLN